jgi:hypothetical protein
MTKLVNGIYNNKKLFFSYSIILFSRGEILTDVIDTYGRCSSFFPRTAPMVVSEASVEIWKGRDQFGPCKIGAIDNFSFKVSNVV